jgi:hypothetical protein
MLPKQTVVRMVALFLLLFAAVDLFAIDLFAPALCAPASTSESTNPAGDEDDCFCCCGHIVVGTVFQVEPVTAYSSDEPVPILNPVSADRPSIYRPPRV